MTALDTSPTAGTYQLDTSRSTIAFTTRHLFGLSGVKGTFALRDGELVLAEPLSASHGKVTADAGSFDTDTPKRDEHVRSPDWLDTEAHPDITFTSDRIEENAQGWTVYGQLTAAGTAVPTALQVLELASDAESVTVRATGRVDRYAHGIVKMKGMAARHLTLDLTIRATRS